MTQDVEMLQRVRAVLKEHRLPSDVVQQVILAIYPDQKSALLVGTHANALRCSSWKAWSTSYDTPGHTLMRLDIEIPTEHRTCLFRAYSVNSLLAQGLLVYPSYLNRSKLMRDFQRLGLHATLDAYTNVRFYNLDELRSLARPLTEPPRKPFIGVVAEVDPQSKTNVLPFMSGACVRLISPSKPRKNSPAK